MKIIGIAGGSGSGKSTVTYHLVDAHPHLFQVLNFDDYQIQDDDGDLADKTEALQQVIKSWVEAQDA